MFTWICPKCGREVGPSYSECPFCTVAAAPPAGPPSQQPAAPQQPLYAPPQYPQGQYPPQGYPPQQYPQGPYPPQQYPPQGYPPQGYPPHFQQPPYPQQQYPPQYAPPVPAQAAPPPEAPAPQPSVPTPSVPTPMFQAPPAPVPEAPPPPPPAAVYYVGEDDNKRVMPPWAAALLAFAAIGLLVYGIISYTRSNRSSAANVAAKKKGSADHPYKRFLELSGFRISEAPGKKLKVEFLAINHGAADMANVGGTITLLAKGAENDPPACTFQFQISTIPGFTAKEIIVTDFTQKRKFFEMPDWQFYEPVVELKPSE